MNPRKPLLTSDRVRAYLTLVPYLLERGEVTVTQAAADFDVTEAQMRQMVRSLTVIGLPGDAGYWQQPQELFDINWGLLEEHDVIEITNDVGLRRVPRLTAREAAALLAGLQLTAALPAVASSELISGLIAKLARGASTAPAEVIVAPEPVDEVRTLVAEAIRAQRAIAFTYRVPDAEPTVRTVDPAKVIITNGQWYLQGWCHLRRAMRTFHLDRVSDAQLTDIAITHSIDVNAELFDSGAEEIATVQFPESIAILLGDYLDRADVKIADGVVTAELSVGDTRSLKRLAGRFGGLLTVQTPSVARAATREWATAALSLYPQD